jgi:hypothetical protein
MCSGVLTGTCAAARAALGAAVVTTGKPRLTDLEELSVSTLHNTYGT